MPRRERLREPGRHDQAPKKIPHILKQHPPIPELLAARPPERRLCMEINDLLARLDGVRGSGPQWTAKCPAHDDRNPSLSIAVKAGRILIHCHAGCDWRVVLAALGLEPADLAPAGQARAHGAGGARPRRDPFRELAERQRRRCAARRRAAHDPVPGIPPARGGRRLAGIWTYRGADGATLGYVARYQDEAGKEVIPFFQRDEHDAWRPGAAPTPRPLYGLDRLAARRDAPVLVVEGEKAADAAQRLLPEYVAVTSPGGSNAAGKADWSPLRGRQIYVWPDADQPGERYARDVARLARAAGAASVRIIDNAALWRAAGREAKDGLDAADWPDDVALPDPLPVVPETEDKDEKDEEEADNDEQPRIEIEWLGWQNFVAEPPPQTWLVEGFVPAGMAGDVFGPPGSLKSTIIYHLAAHIASGRSPWFNWHVNPGRVAILGGESSSADALWRSAHRAMQLSGTLDTIRTLAEDGEERLVTVPSRPLWRWSRGYYYDGRAEGWGLTPVGEAVMGRLAEYRPALVVIDTILAAAHGCDVLNVAQQYALAEEMGRLARELDTTVLTISHTSQASQSGSLRDRLHYSARAGGNGAPGAWRWMMGVTPLREEDRGALGDLAAAWNLDDEIYVAVGVAKANEVPMPRSASWKSPAIWHLCDGMLLLAATGDKVAASMQQAKEERQRRKEEKRRGRRNGPALRVVTEGGTSNDW